MIARVDPELIPEPIEESLSAPPPPPPIDPLPLLSGILSLAADKSTLQRLAALDRAQKLASEREAELAEKRAAFAARRAAFTLEYARLAEALKESRDRSEAAEGGAAAAEDMLREREDQWSGIGMPAQAPFFAETLEWMQHGNRWN